MAENQSIKERLLFFINSLKLGKSQFENRCGLSHGWVNSVGKTIMPDKLERISLQFPDLNPSWLMTGEGTMLRFDATSDSYEGEDAAKSLKEENEKLNEENEELRRRIERLEKMVDHLLEGGKMFSKSCV